MQDRLSPLGKQGLSLRTYRSTFTSLPEPELVDISVILLKRTVVSIEQLVQTIRSAIERHVIVGLGVGQEAPATESRRAPLEALTPREMEVLGCMAQGYRNAAIAGALHVDRRTIEQHVNSIYRKLASRRGDLEPRVHAVGLYWRGADEPPPPGPGADAELASSQVNELTPRELEVLHWMANGHRNGAIAEAMGVAPKTVQRHINSIFSKICDENGDKDPRVQAIAAYRSLQRSNGRPEAAPHGAPAPGGHIEPVPLDKELQRTLANARATWLASRIPS